MKSLVVATALLGVAGCGTTNNYLAAKTKTVEYYRIFDIKTTANRQAVAKSASSGMGRNVNNAQETLPIPSSGDIPDKPGRFKLVNPYEGTRMAAMMGGAGSLGYRVAICDGASWTARAERSVRGSNNLNLSACLFQYKDGYHLDFYFYFVRFPINLMPRG
jgi:hypothetical protein